jgi:hypothetical protein
MVSLIVVSRNHLTNQMRGEGTVPIWHKLERIGYAMHSPPSNWEEGEQQRREAQGVRLAFALGFAMRSPTLKC